MTRQRLAQRPNRSRSRTWIRAMRFCQVSTPAHSRAFSASATVLRAHSALVAIASYDGKQQPERELWKPHSSASRTSRKARVIGPLCWPGWRCWAPQARVDQDAGLGVAVQRHDAAGAEHLLASATDHGTSANAKSR